MRMLLLSNSGEPAFGVSPWASRSASNNTSCSAQIYWLQFFCSGGFAAPTVSEVNARQPTHIFQRIISFVLVNIVFLQVDEPVPQRASSCERALVQGAACEPVLGDWDTGNNRGYATVFPKRNFGVPTWTDWSAWRYSSKPSKQAASLRLHVISASHLKWPGITCADWRRI